MKLNIAGNLINNEWYELKNKFNNIKLHQFTVMPNHIHGIIEIVAVGADSISAPSSDETSNIGIVDGKIVDETSNIGIINEHPNMVNNNYVGDDNINDNNIINMNDDGCGKDGAEMDSAPTSSTAVSSSSTVIDLPGIVQTFKRITTIKYIELVKQNKLPPFDKRIWQRNYWEHIVRNENEYNNISRYIINNPKKWEMDRLNNGIGNTVLENISIYNEKEWMV